MGRDQDHGLSAVGKLRQPSDDLESALTVELDVHQSHVGTQFLHPGQGLVAGRRDAQDIQSFAFEEIAGSLEETRIVVNDETGQHHDTSMASAP